MTAASSPGYRHAGAALLRASTDPGGLDLPEDLAAEGPGIARCQGAWLARVWRSAEVRTAIAVASPALAAQISALVSARDPDARQIRRAVISLASYLLRWQRRATPFGLFAGVSLARIGSPASVSWGGYRPEVRADAGWLGGIVDRLHGCRELMDRIPVAASDAVVARGGRLVAPGLPPGAAPSELAPVEVSVRGTPPARAALEAAREPVPFGKLISQLAAEFPAARPGRAEALASGLLAQGFLVSALRAPMTSADALRHLRGQLREACAEEIPQLSGVLRELAAVDGGLRESPGVPSLLVDTALESEIRIPEEVAREACGAAGILHRVTPYPGGYPAWAEYHRRFMDRYGPGALVPVLELTADSGLGFPAGYLGAAREPAPHAVSRRDEVLLGLVQQGMTAGENEIVLTDRVTADLAGDGGERAAGGPARAEIAVEIRAASLEEMGRGRFTLMVTGVPRPGSSMIGRHAHLLPGAGQDMLAGTFAACEPGAVAAQLSFAPRKRRNENVARTGQMLAAVIPIGEYREPGGNVIRLADLGVTAEENRFVLVRLSTGQPVEPRVTHALEAGIHTPPLARFLAEITTARCAAYQAFSFGAAARMPYLPRVRYRRTILSAARWLLPARDLPGPGADTAEWDEAFRAWRARWRVPDHVAITEHDRRQPADLRHPVHRMILRSRLCRSGQVELREAAAPEDLAWLGRAHELVIPLLTATADPRAVAAPRNISMPAVKHAAVCLPGRSGVLYAQVHGHPGRFDEIITGHLPGLVAALGDRAAGWWFSRGHTAGRDPDPCLGIYLLLPSAASYGEAAAELATWVDGLVQGRMLAGLTLSTYEPETGRFGDGAAIDAVHDVFAADSAAALAQIASAMRAGADQRALTAASMTSLAAGFASSPDEGMDWLLRALPRDHIRTDPVLREQALRLASPGDGLVSLPGGAGVIAAWRQRTAALDAYRQQLAGSRDPVPVLRALLESQVNRSAGTGSPARQAARHLARACALRRLAAGAET